MGAAQHHPNNTHAIYVAMSIKTVTDAAMHTNHVSHAVWEARTTLKIFPMASLSVIVSQKISSRFVPVDVEPIPNIPYTKTRTNLLSTTALE